jgi:hypothetical protein
MTAARAAGVSESPRHLLEMGTAFDREECEWRQAVRLSVAATSSVFDSILTPSQCTGAANQLNEIVVSRRETSKGLTHSSGLSRSRVLKPLNANNIE